MEINKAFQMAGISPWFLQSSILLVAAGACTGLYLLIGVLLGAIDIAGRKMKQFLRS